jgi:hypothetical protein
MSQDNPFKLIQLRKWLQDKVIITGSSKMHRGITDEKHRGQRDSRVALSLTGSTWGDRRVLLYLGI